MAKQESTMNANRWGPMKIFRNVKRSFLCVLVITSLVLTCFPAYAATHWPTHHPYVFEVVDPIVHTGKNVSVTFRLVERVTGKTIDNAVMTEPKLIMLRHFEESIPGQVYALAPDDHGNYVLRANLATAGHWQFEFYFQPPDKETPVHGTLMIHVV
jgi:hypothetical protein